VSHFKLGNSNEGKNKDRCIIPIYFKDKAVGFHGRALKDDMDPRYYNSPGFDIKDYIFNYDGCEKGGEIIVVEGAFNAMSLWEKGFTNVVATFGTKFTPKQVQLIFSLAPESIVICFDRDSSKDRPGQKAAIQLANITYQLIPTYIMPLPIDKDPNDLSAEVLMTCYQKRMEYDKLRG
jgi:DNA primase